VSHRSYPSEGSCTLDTRNLKPKLIAGSYFTDRYTKGDLEAKFIDGSKGHGSFESIKKHIAQKKK